jgi:hypothetical protein
VMTATNKRYSYPRVTVIRIDIHLAGPLPLRKRAPYPIHSMTVD